MTRTLRRPVFLLDRCILLDKVENVLINMKEILKLSISLFGILMNYSTIEVSTKSKTVSVENLTPPRKRTGRKESPRV